MSGDEAMEALKRNLEEREQRLADEAEIQEMAEFFRIPLADARKLYNGEKG